MGCSPQKKACVSGLKLPFQVTACYPFPILNEIILSYMAKRCNRECGLQPTRCKPLHYSAGIRTSLVEPKSATIQLSCCIFSPGFNRLFPSASHIEQRLNQKGGTCYESTGKTEGPISPLLWSGSFVAAACDLAAVRQACCGHGIICRYISSSSDNVPIHWVSANTT